MMSKKLLNTKSGIWLFFLALFFLTEACADNCNRKPTVGLPPIGNIPNPHSGHSAISPNALSADGATDTHTLIKSKGFNPGEDPYYYPGNHPGVKHITQVFDSELNRYAFAFTIHVEEDGDKEYGQTDRQRVEIKTDAKSPANMQGTYGENHIYKWKFKIPAGIKATKEFTHIFQIKPAGGDDSLPMNTLTIRKLANGKEQVELIHVQGKDIDANQYNHNLAIVSLSDFTGEWVDATVNATFTDTGAYSCKIVRLRDSKVLIDCERESMDLWREGTEIVRPKFGIYRSIGKDGSLKSQLKDETLLFADFEIIEK
jgi:hypothetical protein